MNKSNLKLLDKGAWLGFAIVTVASFIATYYGDFSGPIISIIWIGWLISSLGMLYFTDKGKEVYIFAKEAKLELEKVVWPTRQEATQTTFIVMAMVTITGFVLWGVDSCMMWAVGKITQLG
jgi:preprotein translocase subunit SecE